VPGRRPQGETRHTPRPWPQGTARGPAVHEAKPPSPMQPPGPSREQTKPEVRPASSPSKPPSAPASGLRQAPSVAGPPAPIEALPSPSQSGTQTTPGETATPPATSKGEPGGQDHS
jgi:hypothetical protein